MKPSYVVNKICHLNARLTIPLYKQCYLAILTSWEKISDIQIMVNCGIPLFIGNNYVTLHMCALIGASRKLAKITDGCHGYIMSTDPQCQQELQLLGSCL